MFLQILENVFLLQGRNFSSNCYLLTGKRNLLIDTGMKDNAERIKNSLAELALSPDDIELILHTHGHADHFAADGLFQTAEKAMHKADAKKVNSQDIIYTCSHLLANSTFPIITKFLKDGERMVIPPFELKVIHTPGHTVGSVCFYEKNFKLLFSGDTLFGSTIGRYDLVGSSKEALQNSIKKLATFDVETMLPGHGRIFKGNFKENCKTALQILQ